MNFPQMLNGLKIQLFDPKYRRVIKQANSLCCADKKVGSSRLIIQERMTSIAQLIIVFQNSYGFAPVKLSGTLLRLSHELDASIKSKEKLSA